MRKNFLKIYFRITPLKENQIEGTQMLTIFEGKDMNVANSID